MYISSTCDTSINQYLKRDHEKNIHACRSTQCWLLYPLHNYFPLKTKIQIEKIEPNCGQNVPHRYKYFVLGRYKSYFVKKKTDSTKKVLWNDIIKILEFLIDNIFVMFDGHVFQVSRNSYGYQLPLFSLTCSYICKRQTLYRGISRNTKTS